MESNVLKRHVHFIYNVIVTLRNQFYNIFVYAAVKVPRGVLCVV